MKEYLEREAICENCNNKDSCFPYPEMRAKCPVYKTFAADVAPVRHGEWIPIRTLEGAIEVKCTNCESNCIFGKVKINYCPNCGAKMKED